MELSNLFMIAAITKNSYDQCRALLTDNYELSDQMVVLICKYTITLAKTFDTLEDLIIKHSDQEPEDYVEVNNITYLKGLINKCAMLEDQIQERICLTIH